MNPINAVIAVTVGYLVGSISFATIIGRFVGGIDIRNTGTGNPGTANIARALGRRWGVVVFAGDIGKVMLPMAFARYLLGDEGTAHLLVAASGIAAIIGHRLPLFFRFRGGAALASGIGAMGFIAPIELIVSATVAIVLVEALVKSPEYRIGRWAAGSIAVLTPIVVTASALLFDIRVIMSVTVGTYSWHEVVSVWAILAVLVGINTRMFGSYLRKAVE